MIELNSQPIKYKRMKLNKKNNYDQSKLARQTYNTSNQS